MIFASRNHLILCLLFFYSLVHSCLLSYKHSVEEFNVTSFDLFDNNYTASFSLVVAIPRRAIATTTPKFAVTRRRTGKLND